MKSVILGFVLAASAVLAQAQTAAYIRGATAPWGMSTNEAAMDLAFGAGNWSNLTMAGGAAPFLPGSGYRFIYLEGGDRTAIELDNFLTANRPQIEAFVNAGGNLLLNSAPNQGGNIDFGFGGVTLTYPAHSSSVDAAVPTHPIFVGPIGPLPTSFTGGLFGHAVMGPSVSAIIVGAPGDSVAGQTVLGEKRFGAGCVLLGGMTTDNYQSPQPDAHNLRANILSYGAANCAVPAAPTEAVPVPLGGLWVYWMMVVGLAGLGGMGLRKRFPKA